MNVFRFILTLCCSVLFITLKAQSASNVSEINGSINLDNQYEAYFIVLDKESNNQNETISLNETGKFSWKLEIEEPHFIKVVIYPKSRNRQLAINFPLYITPGSVSTINLNYDDETYLSFKDNNLSPENKALILYSNYRNLKIREMFLNPSTRTSEDVSKDNIDYASGLIDDLKVEDNSVKQYLAVWSMNDFFNDITNLNEQGESLSSLLGKYFNTVDTSSIEVYNYPEALLFSETLRNIKIYAKLFEETEEIDNSKLNKVSYLNNRFNLFADLFKNESLRQKFYENELREYLATFKIDKNVKFEKELEMFEKLSLKLSDINKRESLIRDFTKLAYSVPGASIPPVVFFDIDGNEVALESFKGNYIYIDLWASWCGPCIQQIPNLKKLETEYKDKNIVFLSVSIDESSKNWKNKVKELNLDGYQLEVGNSGFEKMMNVSGIPHFILYDNEGKLKLYKAPRPGTLEIREIFNSL